VLSKDDWVGKIHSCEYGAHPRTLNLQFRDIIKLYDFRSSETMHVYSPKEAILSMSCSQNSIFHTVLTTRKKSILIDNRYTKYPILEWELNDPAETRVNVQYLNDFYISNDCTSSLSLI
jgi:hypothetical protein